MRNYLRMCAYLVPVGLAIGLQSDLVPHLRIATTGETRTQRVTNIQDMMLRVAAMAPEDAQSTLKLFWWSSKTVENVLRTLRNTWLEPH